MSFWASSKFILTFWILTKWSTTSVHGIQLPSTEYNFLPRNTTSVLEIQLPSTSASLQYLTHCFQHEWAKNSINSQSVFCTQFAVCILYPICSLQSAFCTDRICIAVFVRTSLKSELKYWSSKKKISEAFLAAMVDVWTVCWRVPEDKHNDRAMITLYQLKTNANACLTDMITSDALLRVLKWTRYGSL